MRKLLKKLLNWAVIAILCFAAFIAWIFWNGESNDFDRPFINDGKDNDLKVVSNTESFYVHPNTHICSRSNITLEAFYYMEGIGEAADYIFNGIWGDYALDILPYRIYHKISPDGTALKRRVVEHGQNFCVFGQEKYRNIYSTLRVVLVEAPDVFGVWLRVRRGDKYITMYQTYKSTVNESVPSSLFYNTPRWEMKNKASDLASEMSKKIIVDPDLWIDLDEEELKHKYEMTLDKRIKKRLEELKKENEYLKNLVVP